MERKCKPGDRFNLLTVEKTWTEILKRKSKETICECVCDCGQKITVPAQFLKNGHKKSCGCMRKKMINKNHPLWSGHGDISGQFWAAIKNSAKRRKPNEISFEITIEEAWKLYQDQDGKCALSGIEITFASKNKSSEKNTASLDRIDSTKPYHINNVQWLHKDINLMKNSLIEEQFIKWCILISNYSSSRHC